ncbi:unnamed protein product [Phytomonas sp. EM1]|nr:unnamed protein product [Phytomonas sp. EM1]|eukprot:CCW61044.1 unnamed protein product [Phytomonas sp. isolate EM1]
MATEGSTIRQKTDDMFNKEHVAQSSLFGLLVGSAAHHYQRLLIRACGAMHRRLMLCFFALGLQQLVWTPLLLLCYFNSMTAARRGFSNPGFIGTNTGKEQNRRNVWSVEKRIIENVMPASLLTSWLVFGPLFILVYIGLQRGMTVLGALIALPWCSSVAFAQRQELC